MNLVSVALLPLFWCFCINNYENITECFEEDYPWVTFPTKLWPIMRLSATPLDFIEMDASLGTENLEFGKFSMISRYFHLFCEFY